MSARGIHATCNITRFSWRQNGRKVLCTNINKQFAVVRFGSSSAAATMTDLTVLISPTPLYAPMMTSRFPFRRSTSNLITPTMVTLETEREPEVCESPVADNSEPAQEPVQDSESLQPKRRGRASSRIVDPNFLSPPVNTFKAAGYRPHAKRHRPTRSQSAPPARLLEPTEQQTPSPPQPFVPDFPSTAINRSFPRRSFTSYSSEAIARKVGLGNLLPPPPPLRKFIP